MATLVTFTASFPDVIDVTKITSLKKTQSISASPISYYIEIILDNNKVFRPEWTSSASRDSAYTTLVGYWGTVNPIS